MIEVFSPITQFIEICFVMCLALTLDELKFTRKKNLFLEEK
jgi:hypothetical protein